LSLPGFMPDALGFATRFAAALPLAYLVAFAMRLDSASSAGLCVAIVSQASPGMAMPKMLHRVAGTLAGGLAALVIRECVPARPHDAAGRFRALARPVHVRGHPAAGFPFLAACRSGVSGHLVGKGRN